MNGRKTRVNDRRYVRMISLCFLVLMLAVPVGIALYVPPGTERTIDGVLDRPFVPREGKAWIGPVPVGGDSIGAPSQSRLVLLEDGIPLGPAHALHADIAAEGGGRYSHWGKTLIFSTSDGSDPNANGRAYTWVVSVPVLPYWVYWACLIIGGFGVYGVTLLGARTLFPRTAPAIAGLVLIVVLVEGGAALILHDAVANADSQKKRLFEQIFSVRDGIETGEGEALNYAPHPYLGFALNPRAAYGGTRQYDGDYLIRRTEPIRPRRDVDLRLLVLGGSTTFGAGVPREQDTWVKLLEDHLRARLGPGTDVINGGVGGYNVVENMLHYVLLLQKLDPDVVVLVTGVNDVHPRLIGDLRPDYSNSRMVWSDSQLTRVQPSPFLRWSRLYRLVMWRRIDEGRLGHIYAVVQRRYPDVDEWPDRLKRNGPEEYKRHLATFVRLLRADARDVIIVPQPWRSRPGNKADEYFGHGVEEHNAVGAQIAADMGIPFVHDAVDSIIFDAPLFWDAVHFNEAGSRVMARFMADWLCARPELLHVTDCTSGHAAEGQYR